MSYQVLARKYRPQRFADVIGQEHVTRTLENAIAQQRIAHGYIFSGHRGIGKTTVARILAMCLNCRSFPQPTPDPCGACESCTEIRAGGSVDVIEIDAATNRGIDEIRELRDAVRYRPARDRFKVYILDEAHQITDAAFNALLKTLEEPPGHVIFMLATTQPEDIPQTIRSRCQHFSFHAVRFADMVSQLRDIAKREGLAADDDALALLAEAGDGSMRDALSLMDQAVASTGGRITAESVRGLVGWVSSDIFEQLLNSVARNSAEEVLRLADRVLTEGHNPAHLTRQLVRFLRNCIVAKVAGEDPGLLQVAPDEARRVLRVAALFSEEDLTRFLQILLRTHGELSYKREQRFHLELGLLKLVHAQRLLPLEEMLSGAEAAPRAAGEGKPRAAVAPARSAPPPEPPSRPRSVSPFEADRARKQSAPKEEMSSSSAAVAVAERTAPGPEGDVRAAVVSALEQGSQRMVASMLDAGEWTLSQEEIVVRVTGSAKMAELALNGEVRRIATAAAARAAGRPLKLRVEGSGAANGSASTAAAPANSEPAANGRARATKDPIVRRMQEKFGAEIRSVIDHREKRR
ncbi:MAG TPA: DNA polymerase III subunit gamma/tau [Terriglobales bacterium]|nr:DNA polymerase III subunit gamma/tau [Terriglobales bacterium]